MKCVFGELGFCPKPATHKLVRTLGHLDVEEEKDLPSYCLEHALFQVKQASHRSY